jgi:CubicO group peptidase (beta-lactamase class C family)
MMVMMAVGENMRNVTWSLVLGLLFLAGPTTADPVDVDHPKMRGALALIDHWLDAALAYSQIPGMSVGIVLDQDLIWSKGYGYANVRRKRPASDETLYSICSISKVFTSIAVMQQRDAGHLRLSDRIADHLDWFNIENAHEGSGPITIEGVLTHSSGLPRESDFPYWSGPDFTFPDRESMMARLESQQTLYPAATYFQYSNLGLTLAGEVVAAASGESYGDYMRSHILEPLELTDTQPNFRPEEHGRALAIGYSARHRDGSRDAVKAFDTDGITAAAGFTSNVVDLAKFASWQFRLLDNGGTEVLAAPSLREMHRVRWVDPNWKITRGIGFGVSRTDNGNAVGHGGACPGYVTFFSMLPEHRLAAIVLINASGTEPGRMIGGMYKVLVPALAAAKKPLEEELPDFSRYTGIYDAQPWSGESAVVQWGKQLAVAGFPSSDPMARLIRLKHDTGHSFHRVRDDGDTPGEAWVFEVDADGEVTGITVNSNTRRKLQ